MNVFKVGCGHIQWDPSTVDGCTDNISYRIRIFSGDSFKVSSRSQRVVLSSTTNSLTFFSSQVPSTRPLRAIVSQLITSVAGDLISSSVLFHMNRIKYLLLFYPTLLLFCPTLILFYPTLLLFYPTLLLFYPTLLLFYPTLFLFYPTQ